MTRIKRYVVGVLLFWLLVFQMLLTLFVWGDVQGRAIVLMAWGLIGTWIFFCGGLMYRYRDMIRAVVGRVRIPWQVTFVLCATILALIEEAIAVSLTNLAPVFGVVQGEAYITASTNYFDVVLFHSVVVFVPFFIAWAILLSRYLFTPFSVFLHFGIVGVIAEVLFGGPIHLLGFAQWIFVYGLMIYLPTYIIPEHRGAHPVRWIHHLCAVPTTFLLASPILIPSIYMIVEMLGHPAIHF